jgi:hypothetical protein
LLLPCRGMKQREHYREHYEANKFVHRGFNFARLALCPQWRN